MTEARLLDFLAAWHQIGVKFYQAVAQGRQPPLEEEPEGDVDHVNAILIEPFRAQSLTQVQAEQVFRNYKFRLQAARRHEAIAVGVGIRRPQFCSSPWRCSPPPARSRAHRPPRLTRQRGSSGGTSRTDRRPPKRTRGTSLS